MTDNEWAEIEADEKEDRAVLEFVISRASDADKERIKQELAECGHCNHFLIVGSPVGTEQDEEFDHGKMFANQTTNGGYSGDEYAGTVSIPIGARKWLQFNYWM